ncbi:hypothetical protein DMA11_19400 [Marinilabiliaceae bacterium JC017]|nr:hypothetical protein DMA11_19400 [Marinilabiliaceae bacterium JC017]
MEAVYGHVILCHGTESGIDYLNPFLEEKEIGGLYCIDEGLKSKTRGKVPVNSESDNFFILQAALIRSEFLMACSGSVMISSEQGSGRRLKVYPPMHIVRARQLQLVAFIEDALEGIKVCYEEALPCQLSLFTGPR